MSEIKIKSTRQKRRLNRTRKQIAEHAKLPRLSVMRSNKHMYAQIIEGGTTLIAVHENELGEAEKMTKTQRAEKLGLKVAEKALAAKVANVVFDKGAYRYHGRVQAFAEAAREGGLKF